jgi:hypothetical protein
MGIEMETLKPLGAIFFKNIAAMTTTFSAAKTKKRIPSPSVKL